MSWVTSTLGDLCSFENGDRGKNYPSKVDFVEHGIPFVNAGNLQEYSISLEDMNYISDDRYGILTNGKIRHGDILFCLRGSLGKFAVADNLDKGAIASSLVIIRNGKHLENRYLVNYLRSKLCRQQIEKFENGAAQPNLSASDLKKFEIPFPPLSEQKRIAAILDKADAIRRKRQQAIQLADDFLRAVFLDTFGDPVTNPKGWKENLLSELCFEKMNNGIFKKNDEYGKGLPVAWVSELFGNHQITFSEKTNHIAATTKEIDKYGLYCGDILFCRSSLKLEGIGWNNVYLGEEKQALFECHLIRMRPRLDCINPVFLNYQLRLPGIRTRVFSQAKTVTMTTIDQDGIGKVKVIVPEMALQDRFEVIFRKTINYINRTKGNNDLDALFMSLSQKAFSGVL